MTDLFVMQTARFLGDAIGQRAATLNAGPASWFFGFLQQALLDTYLLRMARLLEKPKNYPLWNVETVLRTLEEQRLPILDRAPLLAVLGSSVGAELTDENLTGHVIQHFRDHLVGRHSQEIRCRLKDLRDKVLAHHEAVDSSSFDGIPRWFLDPTTGAPDPKRHGADKLTELLHEFVTAIKAAYLGGDSFDLERDARNVQVSLQAVLSQLYQSP